MDAKLKKIQITPVKFDKEGDIKAGEFATVTLEGADGFHWATCRDYRAV